MAGSSTTAADSLTQAHAALLRQSDLQFAFSVYPPPPPPPDWVLALSRLFNWVAPAFTYIFYGGLILGGGIILLFLLRELVGVRFPGLRRKAKVEPEAEWRPNEARARTLLEDADRLAAQGRYGEAVHLLLFRSIEDIDDRWPALLKPALTSRDIAGHLGLPDAARRTFGDIARVVERSFFGGEDLTVTEFAACRRSYEAFALPTAAA